MLVKGLQRLVAFFGPLLLLVILLYRYNEGHLVSSWKESISQNQWGKDLQLKAQNQESVHSIPDGLGTPQPVGVTEPLSDFELLKRNEIFSVSTPTKSYFEIDFGDYEAMNPNIIPHPTMKDTWIVVAQQQRSDIQNSIWFAELTCNAKLENGKLKCIKSALTVPIAATFSDKCQGNMAYFGFNVGPHDARIFYGPQIPYAIYGTQSSWSCFGQWIQDLRMLVDWGFEIFSEREFRKATELQRPIPYAPIEKNWFVFWDKQENMYAHYDVAPRRVFSKIEADGTAGPDLAPNTQLSDDQCMQKYMPKLAPKLESIHQATNSLSITMCRRTDPACEPNDFNTYLFTIFQHKSFYSFHGVYEPYVMLFNREAPFGIHGISKKPMWIHGRKKTDESNKDPSDDGTSETVVHSEMFYVTSVSWKTHGQKYHGYIDDVLFLAFGIEDSRSGGIDVVAEDVFKDIGLCAEV